MSIYIDDFFLIANLIKPLNEIKKLLANKYDMKNLKEVKIIIGWHVMRDIVVGTIRIDQSVFIRDFVIKDILMDYNANVILMKA